MTGEVNRLVAWTGLLFLVMGSAVAVERAVNLDQWMAIANAASAAFGWAIWRAWR